MTDTLRTRVWAAGAAIALLTAMASPASACVGEPPVAWDRVRADGGPAIIVGRVATVETQAEPQRAGAFELTVATATIERLRTVQGAPSDRYAVSGATLARPVEGERSPDGYCGPMMGLEPGQVVLGVERRDGSLLVVPDHAIPADLRPLLEDPQ